MEQISYLAYHYKASSQLPTGRYKITVISHLESKTKSGSFIVKVENYQMPLIYQSMKEFSDEWITEKILP